MKPLIKAALVASLLVAAPVWAHGGSERGWFDHRHPQRHWNRDYHKHHGHHRRAHDVRRIEHVYRYEPYPVETASASPGIHVIFPDVYLPWPK